MHVLTCGCNTDQQVAGVPDVPTDYRMRHPITIREADRTLQLFIGANRGTLTPTQRAELLAFAQRWKREATGGVVIDLPVGTSNERASADALREIQSILAASGVPPQSMAVRSYRATERTLATVRVTYPRIAAQAGPCGLWPEDVGRASTATTPKTSRPGTSAVPANATLAAMVDNPAEASCKPRGETPTTTRGGADGRGKVSAATSTATQYPSADSSLISDVGGKHDAGT